MSRVADLANAITALGIPINSVALVGQDPIHPTSVFIDFQPAATQPQKDQANALAAGWDFRIHTSRTMYAIAADIFALTGVLPTLAVGTQKALIILDLFTGNLGTGSQKWQQDTGPNAAAMSAVYAAITAPNGLATFNAAQQLILAAMYTQDNPRYLVNPSFAPSINIPGDVAVS